MKYLETRVSFIEAGNFIQKARHLLLELVDGCFFVNQRLTNSRQLDVLLLGISESLPSLQDNSRA